MNSMEKAIKMQDFYEKSSLSTYYITNFDG